LDLFTVPTAAFRVLYCHFVIEHGRRRIHFNVTRHQSADRVVQQLREAFPEADPYRDAILDRDSIFDADVIVLKGHRSRAEADGPPVALAERNGGVVDRKLPPGAAGSCHRAE
jgi:hypothetical protein